MVLKKRILAMAAATVLGFATAGFGPDVGSAFASEVKIIVNGQPITTFDISHRAAFLKLQRRKGNLNEMARQDMTDDALKRLEMARLKISIPDSEVNAAYERFATSNKMNTAQLTSILNQTNVTPQHFKEYIRTQMGWGRVMSAKFRNNGLMSEQDAVQRMLKDGGNKPTATEYLLQQVIFVVPANKRDSSLARRRQEAKAFRARFNGCDATKQAAKGILDVTIRDLGYVLDLQLPPDWSKEVKATSTGHATTIRDTEKGVEFLGVCKTRQVSDDRVAQLVFSQEAAGGQGDKDSEALSKNYLEDLRKAAKIVTR